nr:hypothetical protein [Tanacetum cinerariifolium]
MYNVDLKNIVPSGDLTCLFAKETLDESNIWHQDPLGKFDGKVDEGFLVGYSVSSKALRNTDGYAAFEVKEPEFEGRKPQSEVHVSPSSKLEDNTYSDDEEDVGVEADFTNLETTIIVSPIPTTRVHKDHHVTQINGDLSSATQTRKEPKRVHQALKGPSWIEAMQEELLQFKMQKVLVLVDLPHGKRAIVKQKQDGIFTSQDKYVAEILRKSGLIDEKSASTPIDTEKPLLKDLDVAYSDSDYAGASLDRKSTTEGCQFLGCRLISWQCKKQIVVATSSIEAEYIVALSSVKSLKRMLHVTNILSADYITTPQMVLDLPCLTHIKKWLVQIKRSLTSISVKKVNDVTRLQALVDKKKVIINVATIRHALQLDDEESIDCLPNEEIFTELLRMGYEKPSTKLTFHKAFFLPQWKFLIHTILQCMSAKRTLWNEFSSSMALAVICLSTGAANVNADVVLTTSDEPIISSLTPTTPPPPPSQDVPSTSQDAEISMDLLHNLLDTCTTLTRRVENLEQDKIAQALEITKLKRRVKKLERRNKLKVSKLRRLKKVRIAQRVDTSDDTVMDDVSKQGRIIASIDADVDVTLKDVADIAKEVAVDAEIKESADVQGRQAESQVRIYQIDLKHTDKLMTEVVTAASATITVADTPIPAAIIIVAAPTLTTTPSAARRRKGVVIRDPKETATPSTIIHSEAKSKDKGKRILVEKPKPLKKQAQIKQDEAYAREGSHTEAQARKNMMIYLRNMAGFKMEYFKGMKYDDIRPIFNKYFNSNVAFLEKTREQMEEEDSKALKRISESQEDKAAKKQKLDEEVAELKRRLQIVPNDEDDVYTEVTPLARKVPVVDYEIYTESNKPYYKIIRADGSLQLFLIFLSLLRNFDREDLEVLWELVKERFASFKPKNFLDDFLLTTLTYMYEKPNVQAQVWKNQRTVHGLAKVKSQRLLNSCRVHIIPFTSTQMILLVERRYPLTRFTLDQMLNNVRLEVEEVSLELLRFIRQQQQEGFRPE